MIKTFPNNLERKDDRIQVGDIQHALEQYPDASKIYLSPKTLKRLDGSLPEGIEVEERGGVLAWDLWLEVPDNPVKSHQTHQNQNPSVPKIKAVESIKPNFVTNEKLNKKNRGRPRKRVGEKLSLRTLYRRRKEQQGVLF